MELLLAMSIIFRGKKLQMSRARKPKAKKTHDEYVDGATKVFVGAIPSKVSLDEFRQYFAQFGPIDDICLPMKCKMRGINRGHGFVTYVKAADAKSCVQRYNDHYLRAKWVV